ncbi:MAG: phospholipase D-like domain-containing protein [Vicinamibacterales bacterium]|nr:phospholipase D-like domain-containing protein [Vicinamibacterales bacterium]
MRSLWARTRELIFWWWIWALGTVVALVADQWLVAAGTGAMAFIAYVGWPVEAPPQFGLEHEFGVEDPEFLASIAGATGVPFSEGNRLEILNNGDQFYPAMLNAIAGAELSITIEAYIYWAGDIGLAFARALAGKAQSSVRVKILLDAIGSSTIGDEILEILERGGCQLAWHNPVHLYKVGRLNHRTHRKSLIVDGRIGFTGGAGIADEWSGNAQDSKHWRDVQIRIEGPAVLPLQTGFAQNWMRATGELVSGPLFYPPMEAHPGSLALQTIMSSPETGASAVRTLYYLSIGSAHKSIYIANPYFVPDQSAIDILGEARTRGVDVRVMVAGIYNDTWLARQNSIRLYGPLLEAGIQVLEYNHTMLHQKTMVVDGVWGTVGTTNFDNRSFAQNDENNVCFYDRVLAGELESMFMADLPHCDVVTLDAWRNRSAWAKTQQFIASLLQEQV